MVVSVALFPDNQNETKHVESRLLPRLDEGSNPSNSTIFCKLIIISNLNSPNCL